MERDVSASFESSVSHLFHRMSEIVKNTQEQHMEMSYVVHSFVSYVEHSFVSSGHAEVVAGSIDDGQKPRRVLQHGVRLKTYTPPGG